MKPTDELSFENTMYILLPHVKRIYGYVQASYTHCEFIG